MKEEEAMPDVGCFFCEKLRFLDRLPAGDLVWQFPNGVAFLGPWQYYEGYCILVSRKHATELSQVGESERRAFLDEMCTLARAIETAFKPSKLNYELLGNQVPHLHWHLFPRSKNDPDRLRPVWIALDRAERDHGERIRLQGTVDRQQTIARVQEQLRLLTPDP